MAAAPDGAGGLRKERRGTEMINFYTLIYRSIGDHRFSSNDADYLSTWPEIVRSTNMRAFSAADAVTQFNIEARAKFKPWIDEYPAVEIIRIEPTQ